jgi:hypothetical protein
MSPSIEQLIARVDELKAEVKAANAELKTALEATPLYSKILTATLKQTSTGCTMPEKVAQAHALKVTLTNFKENGKDNEDVV